ncbi:hypothetical protein [Bdellovibrio sp. HCB2-146]|uniref:hypothetical protein n=1 Tax=Bdellovibrio sp. HCB2-146 TaxID=3394362 RepID=UPI0039BD3E99
MGVKDVTKILLLCTGALLTMGNQKCEQKRSLKKIIQMDGITSRQVLLPGGGSFDFQAVANQQIYAVLSESEDFTFRYLPPVVVPPEGARLAAVDPLANLTDSDQVAMKVFASPEPVYEETAWCMVNLPQAKISGAVNSFELIGGGGATIGYNPAGDHLPNGLASVGFNVEFAQMDFSMRALRPLTEKVLAATNVTSKQTKTRVNASINIGEFAVGPSAYYQTPLAKVTKNALTKAVKNLAEQLKNEEWSTRVLSSQDTHLVVVGGRDVGLEEGDQLLVYNEQYYWEGEPCNSRYLGGGASAGSAVAKIEIEWVGDEISRGRVIEHTANDAVIGAKVKLFKFHDPKYQGQNPGVKP